MEQVGLLVLVHRDVGDLLHHALGLGDRAGEQCHPGLEEHDVGEGDLPARGQPQAGGDHEHQHDGGISGLHTAGQAAPPDDPLVLLAHLLVQRGPALDVMFLGAGCLHRVDVVEGGLRLAAHVHLRLDVGLARFHLAAGQEQAHQEVGRRADHEQARQGR